MYITVSNCIMLLTVECKAVGKIVIFCLKINVPFILLYCRIFPSSTFQDVRILHFAPGFSKAMSTGLKKDCIFDARKEVASMSLEID
jgi:hypothetical protein